MALGTTSELGENLFLADEEQQQKARDEANKEIEIREARGDSDMLEQKQNLVVPKIDRNLVKKNFKIEMMFEQMGDGGEKENDWYYGLVVDIVNRKNRVVTIKWDNECLHEGDKNNKTKAQRKNVEHEKTKGGSMASVFIQKRFNDK